jgi:hypothetical protein
MSEEAASAANAIRAHQETTAIDIAPATLFHPDAVSVHGGVLTVKNQELASVIQSKLASASRLAAGGAAATDADVSVGIKVHF